VAAGTPGLAEVVNAFGPQVLTPDGDLDRPALGRIVFADPQARERLNAVTHPRIAALTRERVAAAPADAIVVHDVPLLVENRMGARYHLVVVVHAPVQERVRRLVSDRGMSEQDALARIASQADDEARRAAADVVLDNGRDPAALRADVDRLWDRRLGPFEVNLRRGVHATRSARAVLVPPDPSWPDQAARLLERVRHAVGDLALRVDAIGSTAVPGLDAKDVLDVQVVVRDLATAQEVGDLLPGAGLVRRRDGTWSDGVEDGSRVEKVLAVNADPARAVNCHVRVEASPAWREALLLRDWLRATPEAVREYSALKHRLAAAPHASIDEYAEAKTPWMRSALVRAGEWAAAAGRPEPSPAAAS
jgi:dephospho-CoA kinase